MSFLLILSIEGGIKWVLWTDNAGSITSRDTLLFPVGQIFHCNHSLPVVAAVSHFVSDPRFKSQSTFIGTHCDQSAAPQHV